MNHAGLLQTNFEQGEFKSCSTSEVSEVHRGKNEVMARSRPRVDITLGVLAHTVQSPKTWGATQRAT